MVKKIYIAGSCNFEEKTEAELVHCLFIHFTPFLWSAFCESISYSCFWLTYHVLQRTVANISISSNEKTVKKA